MSKINKFQFGRIHLFKWFVVNSDWSASFIVKNVLKQVTAFNVC